MAGRLGVVASNATRTAINPQKGRATRAREGGFKRLIQKQARGRANPQAGRRVKLAALRRADPQMASGPQRKANPQLRGRGY